ncbi:MAG: hypothetical protein QXG29_02795 [Sulfolobales archaeon]
MLWFKYSVVLLVLAIVGTIAPVVTPEVSSATKYADIPHPIVLKYDFNFTIVDVLALNTTHLVLVVSYREHSAVVVVSLEDPIEGPKIVQSYPLAGKVTTTAVDGYPPTRFAVGSDRGEIYLFKIDRGRLYQLLHLIQGADYRVLNLFVARAAGRYKIIATVSEGFPTGLCTNCYVYVFDEDLLGAFVISPQVVTTATTYYKRVYPQVAVPAKFYTPDGYYYRADSIALFWAPYIDTVIAELNVSHVVNATLIEPAGGALIEVSLQDPVTRARRVYGWNADGSGRALVPIPRGYLANITVVGVARRFLVRENINTSAIAKRFKVVVTIPEKVSTEVAEEVYGIPFFAKYYIDFLDVTNAPVSYRVIRSLDKEFYPTVTLPHFIDYGGGYIIAIMNKTFIELYNLDYTFSLKPSTSVGTEYLGMTPVSIVDIIAYSRDDIVIGFSDGRVKHYKFDSLRNGYYFAQAIVTLGSLVRMLPVSYSSYFTFSTRGVQVVTLTPYQLPILRVGFQAEFTVEGLVSASSLPGAGLLALVTPSKLYVVMNLGPAIASPTPVNLNDYIAPSLFVRVLPPAPQEWVNGSRVILEYEIGGRKKSITKVFTRDDVEFTNIIPGTRYYITVIPPKDYIHNYTTVVDVQYCEEKCQNILILANLKYRDFSVSLSLRDEFGGSLLGRLNVIIDGKVYSYRVPDGLNLRLLYGYHEVIVESLDQYYLTYRTQIKVEEDTAVTLVLKRARYNLTMLFIDGLTRRAIESRLIVYINGSVSYSDQQSVLSVTVPAGAINVTVTPPKEASSIYSKHSFIVVVNRSTILDVIVNRVTYDLTVSALDELTRLEVPLKASVYINGTEAYRGLLPKTISLPYAYYTIDVVPVEEYANIYSAGVAELTLDSDTKIPVLVFRKIYVLEILFRDKFSEKPVVPLKVIINGSLYSITTAPSISLPLRAANYVISVEPIEEHPNSYIPLERTLSLLSNSRLVLDIVRQNYTVTLKFTDVSARGYLEGRFRVSLNTTITLVVDGTTALRGFNLSVPYGKYLLTITPVDIAEKIYVAPSPTIINVFSDVSHTIRLNRKLYTLVVIVVNDLEERLSNVYIQALDSNTGVEISSIYTDENGEARINIPAGATSIRAMKGGYLEYTEMVYLDRDSTLTPRLRPTLITLVGRFAHIIALAVVAIAVVIIALKLRTKLAERLVTTEETF